jgi:calcineurin-like phosphoesterase family protein
MADAFVNDQQPETNYGYLDWLRTEASTKQSVSYLRFDVPPLTEAIETATLRVFAERNSAIGYDVRRVADNSWDELTITYSTAPPVGNVVDSSGAFDRGTWTSVDVTPLVTGGGELTVAMTTAEPGRMTRYSSREAGLTSPQLVVSVATGDGDAVAPTTPTQLSATAQMSGGVTLSWLPSTDDVGVTGYTIYRDGGRLATVGATLTTYADISVAPLTSYSYTVDAFDGAGNHSAQSIPALVTTPAAVGDPVITAAGDICGGCEATAVLVEAIDPTYALTLGDNQYSDGALSEYLADYDRSWGRFKSETYPAPGNHDWHTANAQGYRDYFGTRADPDGDGNTWYSWNVGNWHLISLDSDCGDVGGCGAGSPQYEWLAADLLADAHQCTLAYWHHPRFSSGTTHGGRTSVQPFWELLYDEGAEIVLSGHEHNYERFGPQSPTGEADPEGITEFVVGTGGAGHYPFGNPEPNSLVRNATTSGVLKLALHTRSYDFQFVSVAGEGFTDSGSGSCS